MDEFQKVVYGNTLWKFYVIIWSRIILYVKKLLTNSKRREHIVGLELTLGYYGKRNLISLISQFLDSNEVDELKKNISQIIFSAKNII